MFQQEIPITKLKEPLKLVFIGDMHIGSAGFRKDVLQKAFSELDEPNSRWIMLGDAVEGREPGHKFFNYDETELGVDEQYQTFFEMASPYIDQCLGMHPGNHEDSLNIKTTINPLRLYCMDHKIPYLGGVSLTTFRTANDKTFRVCTTHGAGGGVKVGASINKITDYLMNFDADAIICGHFHKLAYNVGMRGYNDELGHYRWKPTHVVLNGSCLQTYSNGHSIYSETKLMPPTALGYSMITLDKDLQPIVRLVPMQ